jgi:hypothetical protein
VRKAFLIAIIGAVCFSAAPAFVPALRAKDKPVSWKALSDALLRVNDEPLKDWNVYQEGKKNDPLLLQLGPRFLLLEVHDQQIFEIDSSKIGHKAEELLWDPSNHPAKPLASSEWTMRDVGAAYRISIKLDSESRVLDLQLPHPLNIGDLPARSTSRPAGRRR